jgi:hypothetical protein
MENIVGAGLPQSLKIRALKARPAWHSGTCWQAKVDSCCKPGFFSIACAYVQTQQSRKLATQVLQASSMF